MHESARRRECEKYISGDLGMSRDGEPNGLFAFSDDHGTYIGWPSLMLT